MNSLNSWLGTELSPVLLLFLGIAGILVLVILLMLVWRAISRPHVRSARRNGRQPRLGVVDSYSVGIRQLVLVRRDNVEHLIMIGGPNDLVVESGILRARPPGMPQRPPEAMMPVPAPVAERPATARPPAPQRIEEEIAPPIAHEPAVTALDMEEPPAPMPAPVPPPSRHFVPAEPAPASEAPAVIAPPPPRQGVVPPRQPGFFQRASARFPNFGRPAASTSSSPAVPRKEPDEPAAEPRAAIDAAHFEELLSSGPNVATSSRHEEKTVPTPPAVRHEEIETIEEPEFVEAAPEPEPEYEEPPAKPEPVAPPPRLTLPELRLPEIRLPELRTTERAPARPPEPRIEPRVEPRLPAEAPPAPAEPRVEVTVAPPPPRPAPPPAPPASAAPPEPDDPFASLEEEMANLLGRGRDDKRS